MADAVSIQEALYPELTCFGCGHANPKGFHLRSYRDGDLTVAEFTPRPEHDNGFGFLNGGIISTVLDCHGAAVVLWEAAQHDWLAAPGAPIPFITAGFEVRFLRPTPLGPTGSADRESGADRRDGDRREVRARSRRQDSGSHDGHVATLPPTDIAVRTFGRGNYRVNDSPQSGVAYDDRSQAGYEFFDPSQDYAPGTYD